MAEIVCLTDLLLTATVQTCRRLYCCRGAGLSELLCIMAMSFNICVIALSQLQAAQSSCMQLFVLQDPVS